MRGVVSDFSQLSTKRRRRQRCARDPAIVRSVGTVIFIIRRNPRPPFALAVLFLLAAFRERIKEKEHTMKKSDRECKGRGGKRGRRRGSGKGRGNVRGVVGGNRVLFHPSRLPLALLSILRMLFYIPSV